MTPRWWIRRRSFTLWGPGRAMFRGHAQIGVGQFGEIYFDAELFADAEEEAGDRLGLFGVGGQFRIETIGGFTQDVGAVLGGGGDVAEGVAERGAPGVRPQLLGGA